MILAPWPAVLGRIETTTFRKWRSPRMDFAMAQLDPVNNMAAHFLRLPLPQLGNLGTALPSMVQVDLMCSSVQFSRSVVSDSLQPHGLQHTKRPCPSPAPRAWSDSCPSSRRCRLWQRALSRDSNVSPSLFCRPQRMSLLKRMPCSQVATLWLLAMHSTEAPPWWLCPRGKEWTSSCWTQ